MKAKKTISQKAISSLIDRLNKGIFEYRKDLKTISDDDLWELCEFDENESHIIELKKRFQERALYQARKMGKRGG